MRHIMGFTKRLVTLTTIMLLAAWPAMVRAEGMGGNAMALHPDAYWYNNEDHGNFDSTPSKVTETTVQSTEVADTTLALHPDAYWYNNEDHGNFIPGSTPSAVIETTVQSTEVADATLALHPDAYWYNNEDHGKALQASTPPKGLTAQAPAR